MLVKPKPLILPKRELYLPRDRRKLPRPAPRIWIPKRFAPKLAVAFDATNATVATTGVTSTPGTSLASSSVTVAASATLVIGVFTCSTVSGTLDTPSAANWPTGGSAMTAVSNKTATDSLSNVYVYAIVSPSTGAHTGTVTFSGGSGSRTIDFDIFSWTGTDTSSVANCIPSANIITDASGSSVAAYPSSVQSVTTANGDAACGVMNAEATNSTSMTSGNGTFINSENLGDVNYASGYHLSVGATTTLQFTNTFGANAAPCCGIFFRIKQPGGGDVLQSQSVM